MTTIIKIQIILQRKQQKKAQFLFLISSIFILIEL